MNKNNRLGGKAMKSKEVVGFEFTEIPLTEAVNAVMAGSGLYSDLKENLLQKLPQLASDKAFAFGLPNGQEVPKDERRGICLAVNAALTKAKLNWKITYSGSRKVFICVPKINNQKKYPSQAPGYVPKSKWHNVEGREEIAKLWKEGHGVKEISRLLNQPYHRVSYVCYQLYPRSKGGK